MFEPMETKPLTYVMENQTGQFLKQTVDVLIEHKKNSLCENESLKIFWRYEDVEE